MRSADGNAWESVADRGFGSRDQAAIGPLHEFKGMLLAGTTSIKDTRGAEVWRSTTGDRGSWVRGADNGWDDPTNVAIGSMGVFTNALYVGTCNRSGGGQIWRTNNGITWAASGTGGTGPIDGRGPACVSALTEFDGYLYAALGNDSRLAPTRSAAAVWRCRGCVGDDWEPVATSGFGVATNRGRTALGVLDEPPFRFLYLAVGNYDGLQVWRTLDGEYWEQSAVDGFGDSNAADVFGSGAFAVHDGRLYLGAINAAGAGELWSTGGARPDVSRPTAPSVATATPRPQPTPPTGRTAYGVVDQWPVVGVIPPDAIGTVDDMTIADDGTAYLADRATNRVMRIGPDGKWGTPIGNVGRGPERIGQIGALIAYSDGAQAYVGAIAAEAMATVRARRPDEGRWAPVIRSSTCRAVPWAEATVIA